MYERVQSKRQRPDEHGQAAPNLLRLFKLAVRVAAGRGIALEDLVAGAERRPAALSGQSGRRLPSSRVHERTEEQDV